MLQSIKPVHEHDQFARLETKFFISQDAKKALESLLASYLKPVDGTKEFGFTRVESHYFETPEMKFYTDSLKKPLSRFKVRVRKYYNGGTEYQGTFIEIKKKENGVSKKKRFRIGSWEETEILRGQTLAVTPRLETLNHNLRRESLISRVQKINDLVENQKPQYAMKVVYDRLAYEGDNLRITIDQNLESELIYNFLPVLKNLAPVIERSAYWNVGSEMRRLYNDNNLAVVEVKHTGNLPAWLNAGFKYLMSAQDVSFSKYVWSMSEAISGINRGMRICQE